MNCIQKTVTLELLREGPAHNQLLSPLTRYHGLCGNFGAVTVQVPYEHQEFMSRLKVLRYDPDVGRDQEYRHVHIDMTASDMAEILAKLPGLRSELGTDSQDGGALVHLNLVVSAAELAMLPFELAKVPQGCAGGEGNWLLLQTRLPISMTRQVRSVAKRPVKWPRKPKILFVVASPSGLTVPAKSHMKALGLAVNQWIKAHDPEKPMERGRKISEFLTVVTQASAKAIQEACANDHFTHVHILAHGVDVPGQPGHPFGLALHDSSDPERLEAVDGQRLASLLCAHPTDARKCGPRTPSVVTVAACDSGHVASVISSTGASLAHDLHQAGIPLVLASQFPLSKAGSEQIPKLFLKAVLQGVDPRVALARLRSVLHALNADTHDWASVVAYASLPEDIEWQLEDLRYEESKMAIEAAMSRIDNMIDRGRRGQAIESGSLGLEQLVERLDEAADRMPKTGGYETEGLGMRGSTEKRKAEAWFKAARLESNEETDPSLIDNCFGCLVRSLDYYEEAYRANMRESKEPVPRRSLHWVLGQYLSLRAILCEPFSLSHWSAAQLSSRVDLEESSGEDAVWPHGTLAELHLLLLAYPRRGLPMNHANAAKQILEHIDRLVEMTKPDDFVVESTRRQFQRYLDWWGDEAFEDALRRHGRSRPLPWSEPNGLIEIAAEVVKRLTPGEAETGLA